MKALAKEPKDRPATASEWFESIAAAVVYRVGRVKRGDSRLVIMAPRVRRFTSTMNVTAVWADRVA